MSTILVVTASPRNERSVSRALTTGFADLWAEQHPEDTLLLRDIGAADSCATADMIPECPNGERPGFKAASPAAAAAATATQAKMARFIVAL